MQAPDLDELVAGPIALVVLDEASICAAGFMAMFLIRVRPYLTEDCELLVVGDAVQDKTHPIRLSHSKNVAGTLLKQPWSGSIFDFVFNARQQQESLRHEIVVDLLNETQPTKQTTQKTVATCTMQ